MPKKKSYLKRRYKPRRHRGRKVRFKDLVRQAETGASQLGRASGMLAKKFPEYEVEVKTASRKLANKLIDAAKSSGQASEVELDVDWV